VVAFRPFDALSTAQAAESRRRVLGKPLDESLERRRGVNAAQENRFSSFSSLQLLSDDSSEGGLQCQLTTTKRGKDAQVYEEG
jgi:hypothetical protein